MASSGFVHKAVFRGLSFLNFGFLGLRVSGSLAFMGFGACAIGWRSVSRDQSGPRTIRQL